MVLNIGNLIEQNYEYVLNDIREVVKTAEGKTVKVHSYSIVIFQVIFETSMLNKDQIIDAAILSVVAGAHFVKTSTGSRASDALTFRIWRWRCKVRRCSTDEAW